MSRGLESEFTDVKIAWGEYDIIRLSTAGGGGKASPKHRRVGESSQVQFRREQQVDAFPNNLATNNLSQNKIPMDRARKMKAIKLSDDFEIHQEEMYYTSNSMNSSDTDSHSRDSSISSGYMMKIHDGVEVLVPTNFVNLDGLHSGVPTRTTPTLTPTTLRNIEQTFIELQCEAESHQNRAGFVPPVVQPIIQGGSTYMSLIDSKGWQGGITSVSQSRSPIISTNNSHLTTTTTTRRNMGGRRPAKSTGISPEEEERRSVRRERNKMAAARCRKRRMDHTNALLQETEGLEQKKQGLQNEIQQLQMQKEELEFLLEAHKACCRLNGTTSPPSPQDIKPFVFTGVEDNGMERRVKHETMAAPAIPLSQPPAAKRLMLGGGDAKPSRPTSLPVASFPSPHNSLKTVVSVSEVAGIPITTPSSGIPFNFDSLMDGGTGLTPVSAPLVPSCSSQQRHSGLVDLSSPDGKLVSL